MDPSYTEQGAYNQAIELAREDRQRKGQEYYALHRDEILPRRHANKIDHIQNHSLEIQMQRLKESTRKRQYYECGKEQRTAQQIMEIKSKETTLPSSFAQLHSTSKLPLRCQGTQRQQIEPACHKKQLGAQEIVENTINQIGLPSSSAQPHSTLELPLGWERAQRQQIELTIEEL